MFTLTCRSFKRSLEKINTINYVKFPIIYPNIYPDPPSAQDYETLGVSPNISNRELILAFRQSTFAIHPANIISVATQREYLKLVEAYDKIALYRMSQDGIPQPYNPAFYPPETHTKAIRNFIDENNFWTPSVNPNYNKFLFIFWLVFGIIHTMLKGDRSLLKNPDL